MKTIKRLNIRLSTLIAAILLATTGFAFQHDVTFCAPSVKVVTSRVEASAALYLSNLQYETVAVSIEDAAGKQMYEEEVSNDIGFAKLYNLTELPLGDYAFRIESKDRILLRPFTIEKKRIVLRSEKCLQELKPVVNIEKRMVQVSADLNSQQNDLQIDVIDDNDNVVYTDHLRRLNKTTKRYNLQSLRNGIYTLKVTIEDRPYYKTLVLR